MDVHSKSHNRAMITFQINHFSSALQLIHCWWISFTVLPDNAAPYCLRTSKRESFIFYRFPQINHFAKRAQYSTTKLRQLSDTTDSKWPEAKIYWTMYLSTTHSCNQFLYRYCDFDYSISIPG